VSAPTDPDLVPARPIDPDELRTVIERVSEKTGKPLKPKIVSHPAVAFGDKAEAAGWRVDYQIGRGPHTTRRRPAEPNEHGKYALIEATSIVDTVGLRAQHPDRRRIAALWVGDSLDEAWAASPRRNARKLGIRDLTKYLTETEEDEMEQEKERAPRSMVETWAAEALADGALMDNMSDAGDGYVSGYRDGYSKATEQGGDAYSEGYAAALAAVAGHTQIWVKARRRLDALRPRSESYPGDVVLGKDGRWWIVTTWGPLADKRWSVRATSGDDAVEVTGDPARLVDVVEQIATAAALAALKDGGLGPEVAA
jgi:hypothetical protein